ARPPDDERAAAGAAAGTLAATQGADLPVAVGGEHAALRGAHRLEGLAHALQLILEGLDLVLQLEDPLDAGEVDALVLGHRLDLPQPHHVARAVAASPATGALRDDQSEPVVLAQGLGVHAG